jgi:hypothetical protein
MLRGKGPLSMPMRDPDTNPLPTAYELSKEYLCARA